MRSLTNRATLIAALAVLALTLCIGMPRSAHAAAALVLANATTTSSTNASSTLAHPGDTVAFQFLANGSVWTAPQISVLNMGTTTMSGSGTSWTYSTTSTSGWTAGSVSFFISFGNTDGTATTTFASTGSSTLQHVRFDKTAPTITSLYVSSSNSSTTLAKIGDVITISFVANENLIATTTLTIDGRAADHVLATSSPAAFMTASSTIVNGDTSANVMGFSLTPVDAAGNASSTAITLVLSGANVSVYGSVPTITISGNNPDSVYASNSSGYGDAGASATDALSHSLSISTSGNVDRSTSGSYTLTYSATDAAGNTNSVSRTVTVNVPGGGGVIVGILSGGGGGSPTPQPVAAPTAPGTSNTSAIGQLQSQIQALMAQIAAAGGGSAGSFARSLTVGSSGSDVKALQIWLNGHGFVIASSGPGSPGNETMKFGGLTRAALAKWQASVGISPAAGYFGPKTRAYIAAHP